MAKRVKERLARGLLDATVLEGRQPGRRVLAAGSREHADGLRSGYRAIISRRTTAL